MRLVPVVRMSLTSYACGRGEGDKGRGGYTSQFGGFRLHRDQAIGAATKVFRCQGADRGDGGGLLLAPRMGVNIGTHKCRGEHWAGSTPAREKSKVMRPPLENQKKASKTTKITFRSAPHTATAVGAAPQPHLRKGHT